MKSFKFNLVSRSHTKKGDNHNSKKYDAVSNSCVNNILISSCTIDYNELKLTEIESKFKIN